MYFRTRTLFIQVLVAPALLTDSLCRKVIIGGVVIYIGAAVYTSVFGRVIEKGLEGLEVDEGEDEEDDGQIFIPFIGTTKELPPKPYHGSDPEWQKFVDISQNKALVIRIKGMWRTSTVV